MWALAGARAGDTRSLSRRPWLPAGGCSPGAEMPESSFCLSRSCSHLRAEATGAGSRVSVCSTARASRTDPWALGLTRRPCWRPAEDGAASRCHRQVLNHGSSLCCCTCKSKPFAAALGSWDTSRFLWVFKSIPNPRNRGQAAAAPLPGDSLLTTEQSGERSCCSGVRFNDSFSLL